MKRDFDLIRSILFQVEKAPVGAPLMQMTSNGSASPREFAEHLQIMIDEGLLDGEVASASQCVFAIRKLTWKGHDFLDAARSDTVWDQAKGQLAKVGGAASLEIFKALLERTAKSILGLP